VASILRARHVTIDTETAVDATRFSAGNLSGEKGSDTLPQRVVEWEIYDPVNVMGEDRGLRSVVSERGVREKADALSCGDDGVAFFGRKYGFYKGEVRHGRMLVKLRLG